MNIFTNNYKKLRQENIDNSVKLKKENRIVIEEMMEYITSNSIALFEVEILKKDLIGIAMEAEEEGIRFIEKLGVSKKEFCNSLLEDAMKKKTFESILLIAKNILLCVAAYNTFFFLMLGCPEKYGLVLSGLIYASIFVGISEFIELKARGKFGYAKDGRNRMLKIEGIFLLLWFIHIISPAGRLLENKLLFIGNGWVVTLLVLAITIFVWLFNNYYWNKQAEKYNWR